MYAIGETSRRSGVAVETIRYYEREGIVARPARSRSGHRRYGADAIARLRFVKRCRELGFAIPDIRLLLDLSGEPDGACGEVAALGQRHLDAVRGKIADLGRMEAALNELVASCAAGKARCPMLETLRCGPEQAA